MNTAILFDLDGTLLDTLGDLHVATNHVLTRFGYPTRTMQEVCRFVGNGAGLLIRRAIPEGEAVEPVLAAFQEYYAAHCNILTRPYDGILQMLDALQDHYPMAVVSNKPDRAVKELAKIYFPTLFAQGETATCRRKPQPDIVYAAMQALGAQQGILVGDSDVDIETAKNAGIPCISVTWGFRPEEELLAAGAQYICRHPSQIPEMIQKILQT